MLKNIRIILPLFFFCFCSYALAADSPSEQEQSVSLSGRYKDYNVILIILDAVRYDHLSCYGYAKETSPNIDYLAKNGVIFTNAFSQSHNTLSGVASIFSSLYPSSHGMEHIYKDKFPDNVHTLAEILNIYGYETAWLGNMDDYHTSMAENLLKGFNKKYSLNHTCVQISNIIKKYQDKHFFITFHSYLTHQFGIVGRSKILSERLKSYYAETWKEAYYTYKNDPEKFHKLFGKDWCVENAEYFALPYSEENFYKVQQSLDSAIKKDFFIQRIKFSQINSFLSALNNEDVLTLLSLLDAAISEVDKNLIGGLITVLKETKLYDKTIIIITADHGDEYLEHGHVGHGAFLYDETIRTPLLFYIPFLLNKDAKIDGLVQNIDILPTVLELLNIPAPYNAQGISLVGQIEGKSGANTNGYIFAKTIPGSLAIRSKQYKLIQHNAKNGSFFYELYNLQRDPLEKNNLIGTESGIADILKEQLRTKFISLPKYNKKNNEFIPEIDPQVRERIKKTGYW